MNGLGSKERILSSIKSLKPICNIVGGFNNNVCSQPFFLCSLALFAVLMKQKNVRQSSDYIDIEIKLINFNLLYIQCKLHQVLMEMKF